MPKPQTHKGWNPRMENLEERLAMSANPLAPGLGALETHSAIQDGPPPLNQHVQSAPDFWLDGSHNGALADYDNQIEQTLQEAHNQTGLTNVRNDYGFTGGGQTVAVIDSGIAWDHFALGGGFGSNYRVVGGWDFTENDADPYDDGPEGSHGTHVAGIVGADSGVDNGVAPDVDLVGLRVFDDAGNGYFSWVEDALQWVHDNRNAFENPITAVNLSLGAVGWNSESIPAWANLENEFAQLEADGIFVSVSAGNSFTDYNATGLSYPAASPYVVPVMSVDDSGNLSYFSQRSTRGIAAPGRWITSTVPDYVGNNNGITDDYATFSGTSMAAPYVAGASVIIREAMEFVGYTNITQDVIYNHMKATAESFYDSATGEWFDRLDLDAAIDALMPTDEFGSTMGTAFDLGTISGNTSTNGVIGTLSDADYFSFTAGSTGTVTFTVDTTHDLDAAWDSSATGWTTGGGTAYTLEVAAGNTYTVGLSSADGIGYYDLDITTESTFTFTDWGVVAQSHVNNIANTGDAWYRVTAGQSGYLTAEAFFDASAGNVTLDVYDSALNLLATSAVQDGGQRIDVIATNGSEYYLKVSGNNSDIDFRLTNLLAFSGSQATLNGTSGDDTIQFIADQAHLLSINETTYSIDSAAVNLVSINGSAGNDTFELVGTAESEIAYLAVENTAWLGNGVTVSALGFEQTTIEGGGGGDSAHFYDSTGNDQFQAYSNRATMTGSGFANEVTGFANTYGYSNAGDDSAFLYDSDGDDHFRSYEDRSEMVGVGRFSQAIGFASNTGYSTQGNDTAFLFDSAGNNTYVASPTAASMTGDGLNNRAEGFSATFAYASTGNDSAHLDDSTGNDIYASYVGASVMSGDGFFNQTSGFYTTSSTATAGSDIALMFDSSGDDHYTTYSDRVEMSGGGFLNTAHNFDVSIGQASTGTDSVTMYGSAGSDHFRSYSGQAETAGTDFFNIARGFESVLGVSSGGTDVAYMNDSAGANTYVAHSDRVTMTGSGMNSEARGFSYTFGYASDASDIATFYDSTGDDHFRTYADVSIVEMAGDGYHNQGRGFATATGFASDGNDAAFLHDSAGDDQYAAYADRVEMTGGGYFYRAVSFEESYAYGSTGDDSAMLYDSAGDNLFLSYAHGALMTGDGLFNQASGFDTVLGFATTGQNVAYLYDSNGDDVLTAAGSAVQLLYDSGAEVELEDFGGVAAFASNGNDTLNLAAIDFYFNDIGDWS
ncbi:MAG: S8 family serine peptidase [Planctomycetota bacterium]